jgi:hypothetical protein
MILLTPKKPDESIVLKPKDPLSDIILTENKDALARFLDEPLPAIAEAITGALASGPKSWVLASGHIVQAALKGRLFPQFATLVNELREKGKIPEDYADKKYGYQSFVEVMEVIDEETPNEDRMEAIQAMFLAVNGVNATDAERVLSYQLLQIAKKLSSGELLLLAAFYEEGKPSAFSPSAGYGTRQNWAALFAGNLGHRLNSLVLRDQQALLEQKLVTGELMDATHDRSSWISDLGVKFCRAIEEFRKRNETGS